ncbi:MAG: hypothetical protein RBT63_05610 [Bdellovibrionales bacterium]|jgi:hypothetical protein|nr:hypothetical protein [Bdellovibrionales bacterium]
MATETPPSPRNTLASHLVTTLILATVVFLVASVGVKLGLIELPGLKRSASTTQDSNSPLGQNASHPDEPRQTRSAPAVLPNHFPETTPNEIAATHREVGSLEQMVKSCWPDRAHIPSLDEESITLHMLERLFGKITKRELIERVESLQLSNGAVRRITLAQEPPSESSPARTTLKVTDTLVDESQINLALSQSERQNPKPQALSKWRSSGELLKATEKAGLFFDDSRFPGGVVGTIVETITQTHPESPPEMQNTLSSIQIRAAGRLVQCSENNTCECL